MMGEVASHTVATLILKMDEGGWGEGEMRRKQETSENNKKSTKKRQLFQVLSLSLSPSLAVAVDDVLCVASRAEHDKEREREVI